MGKDEQKRIDELVSSLKWLAGIVIGISITLHSWSYKAYSGLALTKLDRVELVKHVDKDEKRNDKLSDTITRLELAITRLETTIKLLPKK